MGLEVPEPVLAGRCRCGAGKFLRCGCAGAREDELPVPRAGNRQHRAPLGAALGGTGTRQNGCSGSWDTAGVMSWHNQGGFILNPAICVVPSPLGSEHSELGILWGVGGTGSPRGFANEIKGVFTGRRKEEAGGFNGAQKPCFMCWEWETQAIELSKEKVGSIWWVGSPAVPTASTGAGSGGFASKTSAALRFGVTSPDTHPAPLVLGGLQIERSLPAGSGS